MFCEKFFKVNVLKSILIVKFLFSVNDLSCFGLKKPMIGISIIKSMKISPIKLDCKFIFDRWEKNFNMVF